MPMSGDAIVVVAPADVDFSEPEHFDTVRAFALPRHACVHLHRGTWHWGPYPVGADRRCASSTSRAGATPTTTGSRGSTRDHGVVYEVARSSLRRRVAR